MAYLDNAIVYLFHLTFILIAVIFLSIIMLEIIGNFLYKIFNIGKKNEKKIDD